MLPIAGLGDAIETRGRFGIVTQQRAQLRSSPNVELAFDTFGIRVLGGTEGGRRRGRMHLALQIGQNVFGHKAQARIAGQPIRAGVNARELRVVVQHLLEVRYMPARVRGVARKAAADMVVDAASGHLGQG